MTDEQLKAEILACQIQIGTNLADAVIDVLRRYEIAMTALADIGFSKDLAVKGGRAKARRIYNQLRGEPS